MRIMPFSTCKSQRVQCQEGSQRPAPWSLAFSTPISPPRAVLSLPWQRIRPQCFDSRPWLVTIESDMGGAVVKEEDE